MAKASRTKGRKSPKPCTPKRRGSRSKTSGKRRISKSALKDPTKKNSDKCKGKSTSKKAVLDRLLDCGSLPAHPFEAGKSILCSRFNVSLPGNIRFSVDITPENLASGFISFNVDLPPRPRYWDTKVVDPYVPDEDKWINNPKYELDNDKLPYKITLQEAMVHTPRLQLHLNEYLLNKVNSNLKKKLKEFQKSDKMNTLKYANISSYLSTYLPLREVYSDNDEDVEKIIQNFGKPGGHLKEARKSKCGDKEDCLSSKGVIHDFHIRDVIASKPLTVQQLYYLNTYIINVKNKFENINESVKGYFPQECGNVPVGDISGVWSLYTPFFIPYNSRTYVASDTDERDKGLYKITPHSMKFIGQKSSSEDSSDDDDSEDDTRF
jgi:hypothetical protein